MCFLTVFSVFVFFLVVLPSFSRIPAPSSSCSPLIGFVFAQPLHERVREGVSYTLVSITSTTTTPSFFFKFIFFVFVLFRFPLCWRFCFC